MSPRIIPCLLLDGRNLVKTNGFTRPRYIGDPMNAVRVFSEKGADELMLLDIGATARGSIDILYLEKLTAECRTPLSYGGGITSLDDIAAVVRCGVEKVVLRTAALRDPSFVHRAADTFGNSTISVCVDYRESAGTRKLLTCGQKTAHIDPLHWATQAAARGAGEIIFQAADRDGRRTGYDTELLQKACSVLNVPVVALGGARTINDLEGLAQLAPVSGMAAGSLFLFNGRHDAVILSYTNNIHV